MKKAAVVISAFGTMALNLLGQGQFAFQATSANGLIYYSTDDVTTAPYPLSPGLPGYGDAHMQFYTAPAGTVLSMSFTGLPDFTGWTANTLVINLATAPGKTAGKTITVPNAANGVNVEVEVVGWVGTATTWSQAVQLGGANLLGWSGKVFFGTGTPSGAFGWSQPTGDPTAPIPATPAGLVTGAGGYQGLILEAYPGPEPSATVLTGLGLAVMATVKLIRRRNAMRA